MGYGFGARYFHAPLLAASPACDLVAVMTSDPQRRALVADEHPGVLCADSLAALVEAGAEAVSISTPASTHSELTDAALELGLAVVHGQAVLAGAQRQQRRPRTWRKPCTSRSPHTKTADGTPTFVPFAPSSRRERSVTSCGSSLDSNASSPIPVRPRAAAPCSSGSHLVDQARWSSSDRSNPCTPSGPFAKTDSTTMSSSLSGTSTEGVRISGQVRCRLHRGRAFASAGLVPPI